MTTGDEASGDSVPGDSVDASEGAWWAVLGAGGSLIVVLVIGAIILGAGLGDSDSDQLGASSPADSSALTAFCWRAVAAGWAGCWACTAVPNAARASASNPLRIQREWFMSFCIVS